METYQFGKMFIFFFDSENIVKDRKFLYLIVSYSFIYI